MFLATGRGQGDVEWQDLPESEILRIMSKPFLNIGDLTPEERLRLIEELWESLRPTPEAVPLTDAQRQELDRRLDELEQDGADGIPWDEVLRQIQGST